MKIFIYPNFEKNNAYETTLKTIEILTDLSIDVFMDKCYADKVLHSKVNFDVFNNIIEKIDIVIVIGGDGTILKASKFTSMAKKQLLGINTGRLGFMASIEADDLDKLKLLKSGEYSINRRMMLDVTVENKTQKCSFIALNDAVLPRGSVGILPEFEIEIGNEQVSKTRADGIIFSTPTGSTAYALSAGGPIIEPDVNCIEVTHICPHSLFSRPMLFSSDKVLKLKTIIDNNHTVPLIVDGNDVVPIDSDAIVTVTQSDLYTEIIDINGSAFYKAIDKKLMTPIK